MREIKPLTGLRFVAAFGVLAGHMAVSQNGTMHLSYGGYPWMTLFFCLSGFVLTWTYSRELRPGAFLWARFARIYPLYALVLIVSALIYDRPTGGADWLLTGAWHGADGLVSGSWSLNVEALFYLSFPLLALVLARLDRDRLAAALAGIAAVVVAVIVWRSGSYGAMRVFPPVRYPAFVFGCAMARLALKGVRVPDRLGYGLLGWSVVALVLPLPAALSEDAVFLVPLGLAMLWLAGSESRVGGFLGSRPLLHLGRASFALYLVHLPVRALLWRSMPDPTVASWLIGAGISLAVASLAHLLYEQPMQRWLRSGLRRRVIYQPLPAEPGR